MYYVQWEELLKLIVEKKFNNLGGGGMKEKDKRVSDFVQGRSRRLEEFFLSSVQNIKSGA